MPKIRKYLIFLEILRAKVGMAPAITQATPMTGPHTESKMKMFEVIRHLDRGYTVGVQFPNLDQDADIIQSLEELEEFLDMYKGETLEFYPI